MAKKDGAYVFSSLFREFDLLLMNVSQFVTLTLPGHEIIQLISANRLSGLPEKHVCYAKDFWHRVTFRAIAEQ